MSLWLFLTIAALCVTVISLFALRMVLGPPHIPSRHSSGELEDLRRAIEDIQRRVASIQETLSDVLVEQERLSESDHAPSIGRSDT
ncbi:hypothetical protein FJZ36_00170 [Candidatus Poribacteria bacterium]|nr:hypothetical protein [Candidatus Poribacteria bacterium]